MIKTPSPRRAPVFGLALALAAGGVVVASRTGDTVPPVVSTGVIAVASWFPPVIDLGKVQGADSCGECHTREMEAWKKSTHFKTWSEMHRTPEAKAIATAMGEKSIKRNDLCFNCHYTAQLVDGKPKTVSGVSCESCHGAAQDWISPELHHENAAKAASPADRAAILRQCEEAGMIRPANVYNVARNCYSCHTVPNEDLVNTGGHPAGSSFDLVAWSQGEVRHNYQYSPDEKNRAASQDHLRVLYVVGVMTDLEYSLRGIAKATGKGKYTSAMVKRFQASIKRANKVIEQIDAPGLAAALPPKGGKGLVRLNNGPALEAAADKLSTAISAFAESEDGSGIAAIDTMLPASSKYKGAAQP